MIRQGLSQHTWIASSRQGQLVAGTNRGQNSSNRTGPAVRHRFEREAPMKATAEFDPRVTAKKLLREGRSGALATLMQGSGDPYCSLVNVATAADGSPLLLISTLAVHTRNVFADPAFH